MDLVKYHKLPQEFPYCLSFDLAKVHTGWSFCRWDGDHLVVLETGVVDMSDAEDAMFWLEYCNALSAVFVKFLCHKDHMLVLKERMPMQNGLRSSIGALQALAQCHAIFDLLTASYRVNIYDTLGVPAISEKALFRRLTGLDKVEKSDIRSFIRSHTDNQLPPDVSLDISDSIAVTMTLYQHMATQDLTNRIKELKREQKRFKSTKKIAEIEAERDRLTALLQGGL